MAKRPAKRGPRGTTKKHIVRPDRWTKAGRQKRADADKADLVAKQEDFDRRKRHQIARASIELDPVDILILEHVLLRPYLTQAEIGDLVGLGREAVNIRINSDKLKRAVAEAGRSALEIFEQNKARAARKLGKLIDDPDSRIAIRAAIAHMWPHIHAGGEGKSGDDFVRFIQEAYEQAEAAKPEAAPASGQ